MVQRHAHSHPFSLPVRVEEDEEEDEEQDLSPLPTKVILRRKPPSLTNRLTSRKSAPVLNQIFEEGESDDDFSTNEGLPPKLSRLKMNMGGTVSSGAATSPGATQKRFHRRKSQGRGSSCSSSETSDDDSESHRRRMDKDSGFGYSWNRRDSSEGPPGSEGGNGGGSSSGQGGGFSGFDQGGPPGSGGDGAGEGNGAGGGGGTGGGASGGHSSPSTCCNNCSSAEPPPSPVSQVFCMGGRGAALVESLKLMSLCLSSQMQQRCGGRGGGVTLVIDPSRVTIQKPALPTTNLVCSPTIRPPPHKTAGASDSHKLTALKNGVLQLPLCDATISVKIRRGGGSTDSLLCSAARVSCCQVV